MFDVGFWELAVIFVVGLLVLGPERLPKVAQQLGQWAGKAGMARMLTNQLQDEMNAVDPRRIMDHPEAAGARLQPPRRRRSEAARHQPGKPLCGRPPLPGRTTAGHALTTAQSESWQPAGRQRA
jgi:Tat protein translocase TatB subunit